MNNLNKRISSKVSTLLRSGRTAKSTVSYRIMPKDYSPELKDLILTGCRMRKTYGIKQSHIDKALRDVRKNK